ncbi:MAG: CHAT domain-containing protein [Bacteroidia bacterium]|nr:CHAT domain-containing protein [Bacteroidia bacterium]
MPDRKPVIFLAFANDQVNSARYLRGLAQELRGIRNSLSAAKQAKAVDIVERANATLADIVDVFQDPEYSGRIRVFHYGGHADSYQLLLESEGNAVQIASSEGFARFLANQANLELVFLNGCSTKNQALDLRAAGIPTVIATSDKINDAIAQRFAIRFYKGIGGYASIQKSFTDANSEILTLTGAKNYRSLYLDELETEPTAYPWEIFPDPPSEWRVNPGKQTEFQIEDVKIGKYAHVLCNRYQQNDEFVSSHVLAKTSQPKIYIIHGHRDEKHESLITRFSYEYIGGKKRYIKPVEIKNWPFKGDLETLLKVRIAEHFEGLNWSGKPVDQLSARDLMNHTAVSGQDAIIMQHNIPGESWNKSTAELIRWYIGKFWNVVNDNPDAPQFVIFINVLYSEDVKDGNFVSKLFSSQYYKSKIVAELNQLATELKQNCVLLSELHKVRRPHVEDWLIETNLSEIDDFQNLPDQIFNQETVLKEGLVMARIEQFLKQAVNTIREKYALQEM